MIAKFDSYFKVRRNGILERAQFNQRNQLPGESAETYITELYRLVEHCEYGNLRDEMIRDRLVVGIRDKKTSEQLQMDSALTLEKAKKTVRQKEAVQELGQVLEKDKTSGATLQEFEKSIAEMHTSLEMRKFQSWPQGQHRGYRGGPSLTRRGGATGQPKPSNCSRCGYASQKRGER